LGDPGTCDDGPLDKPDKPWYNTRVEDKRNKATARQLHSFTHINQEQNI